VSLLLLFFIWSFFSRNLQTIVQCPLLRAAVYFTLKWLNIILCLSVVLFSDLHTVHNFKWLVDKSLYTFFFFYTPFKSLGAVRFIFLLILFSRDTLQWSKETVKTLLWYIIQINIKESWKCISFHKKTTTTKQHNVVFNKKCSCFLSIKS